MVEHTVYDSTGRLVTKTEPWWVDTAVSDIPQIAPADTSGHTTYTYDDAGRQTAEIFWVGTDGNPAHEKWRTTTTYNGTKTLQIPPLGAIPTETTLDARGRAVALTQYHRDPDTLPAATAPGDVRGLPSTTTNYTYDPAGRLAGMAKPTALDGAQNPTAPVEWSYEYDWAGRQIEASDPDAGDSSTTYDKLGRVATRTNGNGETLAYTYDQIGRTTSVREDSQTGAIRAEWEYSEATLKGVLTKTTRYVNNTSYVTRIDGWDTAYRPTATTLELPNIAPYTDLKSRQLTTQYAYTVDGQQASITYPAVIEADGTANGKKILGSETVTTIYDPESSMPSWMSGGFGWGTYVASSQFASDGRPISADLGNTYGAVLTYAYEEGTKRLTGINLDRERVTGTELDLHYDYDPSGNVTNIKDTPTRAELTGAAAQDNQCFDYDGLARLQAAWTTTLDRGCAQPPSPSATQHAAPYWNEYTFDVLGNRTETKSWSATAGTSSTTLTHGAGTAGPHAVTTTAISGGATTTYTYDAAGNRTGANPSSSQQTLVPSEWDAEGELTAVGDSSYVYDADGNRLVRTDDTGTTVYLGGQEILIKSDGAVSATRYYAFAGSGTVAVRTDRGLGNGVTSLVNDHHGTPVAAVSNGVHPKQASIDRLYTDPYGARRGTSQADTIPGDAQFLGKTRDEVTGLTQIGARYFDEQLGRFISVDPLIVLTDPQQWNPYAYASNSPLTLTDPSGLAALGATDWEDVRGRSVGGQKSNPTPKPPLATQTVDAPTLDAGVIAVPVAVIAAPWLEGLIAAVTWAAVGSAAGVVAAAGGVLSMCGSTTGGCSNEDVSLSEQSTPAQPPDNHDCLPAFSVCSGDEPAEAIDAIDAIVETINEGTCAACTWEDITTKGSIPNVRTSTTKREFMSQLIDAGWTHTKTGRNNQIDLFQKNGAKYSLRDENSSNHDGPTATFTPAGAKGETLKIRMAW